MKFTRKIFRYFERKTKKIGSKTLNRKVVRPVNQSLLIPEIHPTGPSRYLCVVCMFQDEAPYLREWLEFQKVVGVDHVYMYDNNSDDSFRKVLDSYQKDNFVTLVPWSFPYLIRNINIQAQRLAFLHSISTFGHIWRWMAFIDIDEFLFPAAKDNLVDVLKDYEDLPSLVAFWSMFGHSGHLTRPEGLTIENYTTRAVALGKPKSIVNPRAVKSISGAHLFDFEMGKRTGYDENRRLVYEQKFDNHKKANNIIRLNHYYTRSKTEFDAKVAKRQEINSLKARKVIKRAENLEKETIYDYSIERFVPKLKLRVEGS